jgi:hypothetical protein
VKRPIIPSKLAISALRLLAFWQGFVRQHPSLTTLSDCIGGGWVPAYGGRQNTITQPNAQRVSASAVPLARTRTSHAGPLHARVRRARAGGDMSRRARRVPGDGQPAQRGACCRLRRCVSAVRRAARLPHTHRDDREGARWETGHGEGQRWCAASWAPPWDAVMAVEGRNRHARESGGGSPL